MEILNLQICPRQRNRKMGTLVDLKLRKMRNRKDNRNRKYKLRNNKLYAKFAKRKNANAFKTLTVMKRRGLFK